MAELNRWVRWAVISVVIVVNAVVWAVPSNVVEQIARDRPTLLGRYSRTHFGWLLGLLPVSLIVIYVALSRDRAQRRRRGMIVGAGALALLTVTCATDLSLRALSPVYYIKDTLAYHRPPDASYRQRIEDRPEAAVTYPNVPPGFPAFDGVLSTDARGFRNPVALDRADVVVVGDSFAEGSRVSDGQCWPALLAGALGGRVYNTGMSGYAPQNYLAVVRDVALSLGPRVVLCLFYEENDFRAAEVRDAPTARSGKFFKRSPLLRMLNGALIERLGSVGASGAVRGIDVLSWLPVRVPDGTGGHYYAFSPNQVLDLYRDEAELTGDRHWRAVTENVRRIRDLCVQARARLVLIYAPSKTHVLLPLIGDDLPADKVRAFAQLRYKGDLPPAAEFMRTLMSRLDVKENLIRRWCERQGIEFLSLTPVLRREAARGVPVYFTYDDHWSPAGHEVVARAVASASAPADRTGPPAPTADWVTP